MIFEKLVKFVVRELEWVKADMGLVGPSRIALECLIDLFVVLPVFQGVRADFFVYRSGSTGLKSG